MKTLNQISKFISLVLRHKPEVLGISINEHAWTDTKILVEKLNERQAFNMAMLEEIVRTDNKQRYSFNEDKTLIRANQGHSIPVDPDLEARTPPSILWHGTGTKFVESINRTGLLRQNRQYVHLSDNPDTAKTVGRRHGKPALYMIHTENMTKNGYKFLISQNGVWLTKEVPPEYLEHVNCE